MDASANDKLLAEQEELRRQLNISQRTAENLERSYQATSLERDQLLERRDQLAAEAGGLRGLSEKLQTENRDLLAELQELRGMRDTLAKQNDALAAERDRIHGAWTITNSERNELQRQLDVSRRTAENLEQNFNRLQTEHNVLAESHAGLQGRVLALQSDLRQARSERDRANTVGDQAIREHTQLYSRFEALQQELAANAKAWGHTVHDLEVQKLDLVKREKSALLLALLAITEPQERAQVAGTEGIEYGLDSASWLRYVVDATREFAPRAACLELIGIALDATPTEW